MAPYFLGTFFLTISVIQERYIKVFIDMSNLYSRDIYIYIWPTCWKGSVGLLYSFNRVGLLDYFTVSIGWVCWTIILFQ